MTPTPLVVSGVHKALAGQPVLRDVGFRVPAGSITALIGPNGAGKTTCVSIATGLRRAERGTVSVCGAAAHQPAARALSSVVPQEIGFPAAVRAEHCLRFVAGQRADRGLGPPAAELAERLGLTSMLRRRTGALSGGQQRKLAIAVAMVHAPPLLILDEATTNLDEQTREITWGLVRDYAGEGGAVLVTSHILADIDAHADRVVALDRGRVVIADDLDAIRHRLGGSAVSIRLSPDLRSVVADRVRLLGLGTVVSTLHDGAVTAWRSRQPLRLLATVAELDPAASDVTVRPVSLGEVLDELATWAMSPAAPPRIPPAAPPTAAAERAARRC